nr:tetratricopeptide repeat protein [Micromonospora sp. DSM 115978]
MVASGEPAASEIDDGMLADVRSMAELAGLLRQLRRRQARRTQSAVLSYRKLAGLTGWAHGTIGHYLSGQILPPTDRFDALVRLLGASPAEQGRLATIRDRVDERRRAAATLGDATAAPRHLPAGVSTFVGRRAALRELERLLTDRSPRQALNLAVVSGPAGVGKTTLVLYWAHQVADRFPGGQIFLDLHGFSPVRDPMNPPEAMRRLLTSVGVPEARIPTESHAQAGLLRSTLDGRRALIVLDNAAGVDPVRALLPALTGCLVLVTGRGEFNGLLAVEGARPIPLDLPSATEARQLLATRLSPARFDAEPSAVDDIVTACARLPLALAVVAARAAAHPGFGLAEIAAELRSAGRRLDLLAAGDAAPDVRAAFSWSYQRLGGPAARLFRLLGLHPGPDITAAASASLAGMSPATVAEPLTELSRAGLITEHRPGRYTFHDLLRAYAVELARTLESATCRSGGRDRVIDHYLHSARHAVELLDPEPYPVTLADPIPGVTPESFETPAQALAWLAAERAVLIGLLGGGGDLDRPTWQLALYVAEFVDRRADRRDGLAAQRADLADALRRADRPAEAQRRFDLGRTHLRAGDHRSARAEFDLAVVIYRETYDRTGQGRTHRALSVIAEHDGRLDEARLHAELAMRMFWAAGSRAVSARALYGLGRCHAELGDHREALHYDQQALALLPRPAAPAGGVDDLHRRLGGAASDPVG